MELDPVLDSVSEPVSVAVAIARGTTINLPSLSVLMKKFLKGPEGIACSCQGSIEIVEMTFTVKSPMTFVNGVLV